MNTKSDDNSDAHTPGPWFYHDEAGAILDEKHEQRVATVFHTSWMSHDENVANARLIAAAPEMYEALKNAYQKIWEILDSDEGQTYGLSRVYDQIGAAIAKAEGRS